MGILTLTLVFGFDFLGPVVVLLVVKRRTGRWRHALVACFLSATVVAFLLTGTVSWLLTVLRSVVSGYWNASALMVAFPIGGVYGVMFAVTWLALLLPVVALWRLLHRSSFDRVTNANAVPAPPVEM